MVQIEKKSAIINFIYKMPSVLIGYRRVVPSGREPMTDTERQLLDLLRERCYQEGEYTLSSGEKSDYYFDAKMLFMSSVGASLIGEVLYEKTKDLNIQAIGGLEVGAIPLTTAAVYTYQRHKRRMDGFFVRNEAKKHGTRKIIEGCMQPGSKVVIVDDVATKGGSIMKAVKAVRHCRVRTGAHHGISESAGRSGRPICKRRNSIPADFHNRSLQASCE